MLDAFGFDRILIETVGVGQSELDVARTADTTSSCSCPESGDSIQTLKAGLMEIADIFVVNKADRPGADRLRTEIELMLGLRAGATMLERARAPPRRGPDAQQPGATGARGGAGASEDVDAAGAANRRRRRARDRRARRTRSTVTSAILKQAESCARGGAPGCASASWTSSRRGRQRLWTDAASAWLDEQLPASGGRRATNPFDVADALLARSADLLTGRT